MNVTVFPSIPKVSEPSMFYIVTYDHRAFGHRVTGTYDLDLNKHSRKDVAHEIATGLVPGVEKIYECPEDRPLRDITEDIARDVRDELRATNEVPDWELAAWLQSLLGVYAEGCQEAAE